MIGLPGDVNHARNIIATDPKLVAVRERAAAEIAAIVVAWDNDSSEPIQQPSSAIAQHALKPLISQIVAGLRAVSQVEPNRSDPPTEAVAVTFETIATSPHPLAVALREGKGSLAGVAARVNQVGMPPCELTILGKTKQATCAIAMLHYLCDLVCMMSVKSAAAPEMDSGGRGSAQTLANALGDNQIDRLKRQAELEIDWLIHNDCERQPEPSATDTAEPTFPHSGPLPINTNSDAAGQDPEAKVTIKMIETETGIPYTTLTSRRLRLAASKRPQPISKDKTRADLYRRADWEEIVNKVQEQKGVSHSAETNDA